MQNRTAKFVSAICASLLAGMPLTTVSQSAVPAADETVEARVARTLIDEVLRKVTGAYDPFGYIKTATPTTPATPPPTTAEFNGLRYLAQLAVNIVDFIDEDDISTPFCFYPVAYQYYTGNSPTAAQINFHLRPPQLSGKNVELKETTHAAAVKTVGAIDIRRPG